MYTAGILTISDSASKGDREDASGTVISRLLSKKGFDVLIHKIVPDEQQTISKILMEWVDEKEVDIIVTTGGTGLTPRD
ncbi:MAG: MogA/MoaB family molybdenum cofactor biosynthesis protein, partial [Dissulfurimicrobium sp.]